MDIKHNRSVPNNDRKTKGSQRETRKTPKEGGKFCKNISKYCWTHEACAHSSSDCPDRAKGHKTTATFQDKMDGSLARCEWWVELGLNLYSCKINNIFTNKPVNSPLYSKPPIVIAKGDSTASHNYWREQDKHYLTYITSAKPCEIILSNATAVKSSQCGRLPLSAALSNKAKDATIIPKLKSSSLISLGQLCDDGCNVELDKLSLKVFKHDNLILKGYRNLSDGL